MRVSSPPLLSLRLGLRERALAGALAWPLPTLLRQSKLLRPALGLDNGLGLTPQMGWSSWNDAGSQVNESWVKATARYLIESELARGELKIPLDIPLSTDKAYYIATPEGRADEARDFRDWMIGAVSFRPLA